MLNYPTMARNEHEQNQDCSNVFYKFSSDQFYRVKGQLENNQISKEDVIQYLLKICEQTSYYSTYFELTLEKHGLLSVLEEAEIIPVLENPNPFNPIHEENLHDNWWRDFPEAEAEFGMLVERREKIFQLLYAGAVLGLIVMGYKDHHRSAK